MPTPDPVPPSTELPSSVDVAIIGGGVIGVSAAWHLVRSGHAVALFEKGEIACEQSSRNWGYCRQQGRDPVELPLVLESLRIWRTLNKDTSSETGFREKGILYVTNKDKEIAGWEAWLKHAKQYQLRTDLLDSDDVAALVPDAVQRWKAGLWTPSDGHAEPATAVPALARDAQARGAHIFTQCAARGLDIMAGKVCGLVTERGRIKANAVLLAGGAWARLFCKRHGIRLKSLNVKASVLRTGPAPDIMSGGLASPEFSIRRRDDGGYSVAHGGATTYQIVPDGIRWFRDFWPSYLVERKRMKVRFGKPFFDELFAPTQWPLDGTSPFEETRVLNPDPDDHVLDKAIDQLTKAFPKLAGVPAVERWAGMIDATPDAVPVISSIPQIPGFFIASGFSGHGFGLGPGAGKLAAELATGAPTCVDAEPFSIARLDRRFPGPQEAAI